MENVIHLGLIQHFKNAEEYLVYVQKKYGPYYVRVISEFAENVDFASTYNRTIDCRIIGGEVIKDAGEADLFNLCSVAINNRLKIADPVVAPLLFLELLDKPHLMKRFNNLYVIVGGIPAKVSGHLGVSMWFGGQIPDVKRCLYANLGYTSFVLGMGFVFEVLNPELLPTSFNRA